MTSQDLHVLLIPSWYVTEEEPLSGVFFKEQAIALAKAGVEVGVVHTELRPLPRLSWALIRKNYFQTSVSIEDHVPVYRRHGWNVFPKMERMKMHHWVHCLGQLAESYIKQRGKPDLLHAHSAIWGGVAAHLLSKQFSIPYVVTEHRDWFLDDNLLPGPAGEGWCRRAMQDVFGDASRVIAISTILNRRLSRYLPGKTDKLATIPNLVDSEFFSLPPSARPPLPFRFFSLTNLVRSKGLAFLLNTFAAFLERDPSALLEIGGDGPERLHLEALAQTLGIAQRVHFLGSLSRLEVKEALHRAHAFIHPSLWETFGIVLIEAMSTGIPVIATRCGGPEDIVTDDVGRLVNINDQEQLIRAMMFVKNNAHCFDAQRIRQRAIDCFGQERIVRQLVDVYHACKTR
jgi:L-malate glycosyltransferase